MLLLTDYLKDNKVFCKAEFATVDNIPCEMINNSVATLHHVTEFSFHNSGGIYSGHLEQLAFACPNLQHLDLQGCSSC